MVNSMISTHDGVACPAPLQRTEIPLYVQLSGLIRRKIETNEWSASSKIPSLDELAAQFGVARVTARQAVKLLEKEALLLSRQGKGTFVSDVPMSKPHMALHTKWADLINMVEGTTVKMLEEGDLDSFPQTASPPIDLVRPCHYMRRIHSKDGKPYNVIKIYLDKRVYDLAPKEFSNRPVVPILGHLPGVKVLSARQTLTIGAADIEIAQMLDLPLGAPIANVRRVILNDSRTVIYFGEISYRGDYIELDIDMNVEKRRPSPQLERTK